MAADNSVRHYAARLDTAQGLLDTGDVEKVQNAIDICLKLRLSPSLGIYARARMNMILAKSYQIRWPKDFSNIEMYAYEVLDLFDIYRQKHDDETSAQGLKLIESMEEKAKNIIDDVARSKSIQNEQNKNQEPTEDTVMISEELEDLQLTSPVKKPIKPEPKKIIWQRTSTPEERAQIEENRKKNPPLKIEGYLRDSGLYKDIVKYVPLSREHQLPPTSTAKALITSGLPTPDPTSDLRSS